MKQEVPKNVGNSKYRWWHITMPKNLQLSS